MKAIGHSTLIHVVTFIILSLSVSGQEVEVDGTLKVTQMSQDNSQGNLVVQHEDGTLGLRQSSSLPNGAAIDTTRNLASDFALAKHMCECQNFPPFLIRSLLDQGYTESELIAAGIPATIVDQASPILDGDGNQYTSTVIGNQTWLVENLRTTSKIDGTPIPLSTNIATWQSASTALSPTYGYVNYDNGNTLEYGLLYNGYTVADNDVCPLGYRVPTSSDFSILDNYLGTSDAVLIKNKGFDYWSQPNQFSTNSSRFSARGAGIFQSNFSYLGLTTNTSWWTTSEVGGNVDYYQTGDLWLTATDLSTSGNQRKSAGGSIRCIKN